jgi:lipopolysaccharide export system permease protein
MTFAASRLGWYFGGRFLRAFFYVMLGIALLTYTIDLFELLRKSGFYPDVRTTNLLWIALLRLPAILEQILPFAILLGAIMSFLDLSRRLELVVARAAGLSAWQFISPAFLLAILIGVFAMFAINPLVVRAKEAAEAASATIFGNRSISNDQFGFWLRQRGREGDAVLRAESLNGPVLTNATVFLFEPDGRFKARLEAATGTLMSKYWQFDAVAQFAAGQEPIEMAEFRLETSVTLADLEALADRSPNASFWSLPGLIHRLELAGLSSTRYRLALQSHYSKPALFAAMVLIAASVSLRFFRMGGVARLVGFGILGGFGLYVLNQVGHDLGEAGIIPVVVAAWAPAVIGFLAASQTLLKFEDG